MARKQSTSKKPQADEPAIPPVPVVTKDDNLAGVPGRKTVAAPERVRSVRTTETGPRRINAITAGKRSTSFAKGGEAFAAYCRSQGIDPDQRREPAFWEEHLTAFAERPIGGHRRRTNGNHKPNRTDLR